MSEPLPEVDPGEDTDRFGKYMLLGTLGTGGGGAVYRALDTILDREVALKLHRLPRRVAEGDSREAKAWRRFIREAQATARLDHPSIPALHDANRHDGTYYLATELVEGPTLARRLRDGAMPPRDCAMLLIDVAEALSHAHERGIIHNDLKPKNILIDAQGKPHIIDFGVALVDESSPQSQPGRGVGTPAYMSPERARGKQDQIGAPSDLFALGVVMYEMLTGKHAFHDRDCSQQTLRNVVYEPPTAPRELTPMLHPELERICLRCLHKAPEERYQTAEALAADLKRFCGVGRPAVSPAARRRVSSTHVGLAVGGVGAIIGFFILSAVLFGALFDGPDPEEEGPPPRTVETGGTPDRPGQPDTVTRPTKKPPTQPPKQLPPHRRDPVADKQAADAALRRRLMVALSKCNGWHLALTRAETAAQQRIAKLAARGPVAPAHTQTIEAARNLLLVVNGARKSCVAYYKERRLDRATRALETVKEEQVTKMLARLEQTTRAMDRELAAGPAKPVPPAGGDEATRFYLTNTYLAALLDRIGRGDKPADIASWCAKEKATHPAAATVIDQDREALRAHGAFAQLLQEGARALAGQSLTMAGQSWKIVSVRAGARVVLSRQGMTTTVIATRLDPKAQRLLIEARVKQARTARDRDGVHAIAAIGLLFGKDPERLRLAEAHVKQIGSRGADRVGVWIAGLRAREGDGPRRKTGHYEGRLRERAALARRNGGTPASEKAVDSGLRWLATHQADDGSWSAAPPCRKRECGGEPKLDWVRPGVTALATLAFLGAGHTQMAGSHKAVVAKGLAYLMRNQDKSGRIGARRGHYMYNHAIGALALVEAYGMTRSTSVGVAARRAISWLVAARNPTLAWRYGERDGDNDTSVTGWAIMALDAAKRAGLGTREIDRAIEGGAAFVAQATDDAYGLTGYRSRPPRGWQGPTSTRFVGPDIGVNTSASHKANHTPTAIAMHIRTSAGVPSADPRQGRGAIALLGVPPLWDKAGKSSSIDLYYWFHGTVAMLPLGGLRWAAWNRALLPALVPTQVQTGHAAGSWDPIGAWGFAGGRCYATALGVLTLSTYYRCAGLAAR